MKYSVVIANMNLVEKLALCVGSIFAHTKDFEIIIVDNGSTDGSQGYVQELKFRNPDKIKYHFFQENKGFAAANNIGIKMAEGDYIILLNNDCVVTPGWADRLAAAIEQGAGEHVGASGPMSNNSAGRQMLGPVPWNGIQWLDAYANDHYEKNKGKFSFAGRLFGWCICFKKSVLEGIGLLDERFFPGGYEDNDICLRLALAGYKMVICIDTFIHHFGQQTYAKAFGGDEYLATGKVNREKFFEKWVNHEHKKLVAVYRVKNCEPWLERSLSQTSLFADEIIVLDTGSTDRTLEIVKQFPKVTKVECWNRKFQEDVERNWLLQETYKHGADWVISVDGDEIYEDKFVERSQAMMSNEPETFGYWCQWKTLWTPEKYRADGIFGGFTNYRFFRLLPNMEIKSKHPQGHHCGSAPQLTPENLAYSNIRVVHLGYDTQEQRQKKYDFYQTYDVAKDRNSIGREDYGHLIEDGDKVKLLPLDTENGISLCMMVKNEEKIVYDTLVAIAPVVDEFIIVDTGSADNTLVEIEKFTKRSTVPVKVYAHPWTDNFSEIRNFAKSKSTQKWILVMDADERFNPQDVPALFKMIDEPVDCYLFDVANYLQAPAGGQAGKFSATQNARMFRNIPEFYYTGLVHETVDDAVLRLRERGTLRMACAPITLHHHGYMKPKEKVKAKLDAYERINLKQMEITDGKDARPYYNLALHYLQEDNVQKAKEYLEKAITLRPEFWQAHTELASMFMRIGRNYLEQAVAPLPAEHNFRRFAVPLIENLKKSDFGHTKINL